ncbi:hypothetical protein FW774_06765 [Pedobacter sp. BS3]|uniref:hypothetical protein n=1 Tax=Pedobacter sp. BS3 TaxID=2567937 RepID=UPI0011ECCD3A|nr:hypothetical protein [Pedobacter sp. BS3]TZF84678.1 hypothetical protein FW774_06765 [Pedobacter sp. BS3]
MKIAACVLLCCLLAEQLPVKAKEKPYKYDAVLYTSGHNRYKGNIETVTDKGISLIIRKQQQFFSADSISSIKIKRHSALSTSMLLGSVAGLGGGAVLYNSLHHKDKVNELSLPVFVVGSIVYGASLGALVNSITAVKKYHGVGSTYPQIRPQLEGYAGKR